MKKSIVSFVILGLLSAGVLAQTFDFSKSGDSEASQILKDYIMSEYESIYPDTVGYFCDIDNDGKKEVIGIVKSSLFYSLAGYKLFVLRKNEDKYELVKSDVIFDNSQSFEIDNGNFEFYRTFIYKNKKYKARYKNNEIITKIEASDFLTDRKVKNIENITQPVRFDNRVEVNLVDIPANAQPEVNIRYKNLSERTKHYLSIE